MIDGRWWKEGWESLYVLLGVNARKKYLSLVYLFLAKLVATAQVKYTENTSLKGSQAVFISI